MAGNFRSLYRWRVPAWLSAGDGGKVLYAVTSLVDVALQKLRDGLTAKFPSYAGPSANALTGADRGIRHGRDETNEHYAARLKRWRSPRGHRVRGSAFAWLEQVSEYFGGLLVWSVDAHGDRFTRTADGVESVTENTGWVWDEVSGWSRFWGVIDGRSIFSAHPDWGSSALWGGVIDPTSDYSIGQLGVTPGDVTALREMLTGAAWRPAGTQPEWIVVLLTVSSVTPDATWQYWSRVDEFNYRLPSRAAGARYWSLAPSWNNIYAGRLYWTGGTLLAGAYEDGDETTYPASVTLPGGSTYAGNPANFPASVTLLDDGDHL